VRAKTTFIVRFLIYKIQTLLCITRRKYAERTLNALNLIKLSHKSKKNIWKSLETTRLPNAYTAVPVEPFTRKIQTMHLPAEEGC
jgi:hypothetical protein